ncbi:MAG: hypothetical protein MZW92_10935 [Comamonadaceae bacterium]|nr:hypothetical protein [Comamonadaceae bacterium]
MNRVQVGRDTPAIVFGFSKDHRPDLKQLLFILTVDRRRRRAGVVSLRRRQHQRRRVTHIADLERAARGGRARRLPVRGRLASCARYENMQHIARRGRALRHRDAALAPGGCAVPQVDPDPRAGLGAGVGPAQCAPRRRAARPLVRLQARSCPRRRCWPITWVWSTLLTLHQSAAGASSIWPPPPKQLEQLHRRLARRPRPAARRRRDRPAASPQILERYRVGRYLKVHARGARGAQLQAGAPRAARSRHRLPQASPAGASTSSGRMDEAAVAYDRSSDGMYPLLSNDRSLTAGPGARRPTRASPRIEKRFEQVKTVHEIAPVFLKNEGAHRGAVHPVLPGPAGPGAHRARVALRTLAIIT